jgi:predicted DNA-binding transcriptional regulator YafY
MNQRASMLTKAFYLAQEMNYRAMPVRHMASELMVTERTIYRYLKAMKAAGIPISQNQFGNYGISLPAPEQKKGKRKAKRI